MRIPGLDIFFDPVVPAPLVLLLGMLLLVWTIWAGRQVASRLSPGRRRTLLVLRLFALALVLLILLQPSRVEEIVSPIRKKVTLVALDTSASMRQTDSEKQSRIDAGKRLLWDAGISSEAAPAASREMRLFEFGENAKPLLKPLNEIKAAGASTRFDDSIRNMLGSLGPAEAANGIFLLTDGHDFQLTSASQTGLAARMRQVPIYAVPLGGSGLVRDVSVRITSYQPVSYVRQLIRVSAAIRLIGCPYEKLNVTLCRDGVPIQHSSVVAREEPMVLVSFDTTEEKPGQYEYEVKVDPVTGEAIAANNSAVTYANVLDKKIRILLIEGEPYWDTTFLMRALRQNSKFDLDSVTQYAKGKVRVIRSGGTQAEFKMPETLPDWSAYDVVILGRGVENILTVPQVDQLTAYVEKQGGALVFSRANAFSGGIGDMLQPVSWKAQGPVSTGLAVAPEGRAIGQMRLLSDLTGRPDLLPAMIGACESADRKTLTATLATTASQPAFPAFVHRRHGAGQVLSVGVDGLWRWAFHAKADPANPVFDKFWDQTILWLMGGRSVNPGSAFTFRVDTANVALGEKVRFNLISRNSDKQLPFAPVTLERDRAEIGRITCTPKTSTLGAPLSGEYLPDQPGRYLASVRLPDGSTETARFFVYQDNEEETEVSADPGYLRRLCEASGGRLVRPDEFRGMLNAAKDLPLEKTQRTRKVALWDRFSLFWLIGLFFGSEGYLRRRWGLC